MLTTTLPGPLYGSLDGLARVGSLCLLFPLALFALLWWLMLSDHVRRRRARRPVRLARLPELPPAPPGGRTLTEWVDAIHQHALAWLDMEAITADGTGLGEELQGIIRHTVETEVPVAVTLGRPELVTDAVVDRLLGVAPPSPQSDTPRPETPSDKQETSE